MAALALVTMVLGGAVGADLPEGWSAVSGDWARTRDVITMLHQRSREGSASAVLRTAQADGGAWRCIVQPSVGAQACGLWFAASEDLSTGFRCELGAPGERGFSLKSAEGEVLWSDLWAPCAPYHAYILEGVAEAGRVRVQLLASDAKTLLSQSDWVETPGASASGCLGVYTENAIARFWGAEHSETPLAEMTDNAPNKMRLYQGPDSEWAIVGTGDWRWTSPERNRIRQFAATERAWAILRTETGAHRVWQSCVRVAEGAGGAGLIIQSDEGGQDGFTCWLGGTFGNGGLMLYRNGGPGRVGQELWSSEQGKWHYNEDLMLRAETRPGEAKVSLYQADGTTLITESPWTKVAEEDAGKVGRLCFHTWLGSADFWGFAGEAGGASAGSGSDLGPGWSASAGSWAWTDAAQSSLEGEAGAEEAWALNSGVAGSRGVWRCTVTVAEGTEQAGLGFQVTPDRTKGFVCVLSPGKLTLRDLSRTAPLWEDAACAWKPGETYILEGRVMTDRVAVRLLSADGATVLSESMAAYVSDTNNDREGVLGLLLVGGSARFEGLSFVREAL